MIQNLANTCVLVGSVFISIMVSRYPEKETSQSLTNVKILFLIKSDEIKFTLDYRVWHSYWFRYEWISEYIRIKKIDTNECPNKYS